MRAALARSFVGMVQHVKGALIALTLLPIMGLAADESPTGDEVMMSVVGSEEADEQAFVDEIRLPQQPPTAGGRSDGADSGAQGEPNGGPAAPASEARNAAAEARNSARETARENRGGRPDGAGRPDNPGGGRPDDPGRGQPDNPGGGRPDDPGGGQPDNPGGGRPDDPGGGNGPD